MERERGVSIICPAYNQEKYIARTLDSFLMQKTDFPVEILIHDDASTDNTGKIIREYSERYPDRIFPVIQTENQYSKGINVEQEFLIPKCRYSYTAMCDGDDYWTDEYKLQKQVLALDAHPDIDICAHRAVIVNAATLQEEGFQGPSDKDAIYSAQEVIDGNGGFVATGSIVYRTLLDDHIPEFRIINDLDYGVQIHGSLKGGMLYLGACMSVYRTSVAGSWTSRISKNPDNAAIFFKKLDDMFVSLNQYTQNRYPTLIGKKHLETHFLILEAQGRYRELFGKEYREILRQTPFSTRMKYCIGCLFPTAILNRERRK